ncbi:TPA: hypothetical protein ACQJLZ_000963 [Citrobacter freundii]
MSLTGWQLPHAVEKKHRRHEDARPQTRCDGGLAGGAERIRGSLETLAAGMVLTDQRHMQAASCASRATSAGNRHLLQPRLANVEKESPAASAGLSGRVGEAGSMPLHTLPYSSCAQG